MNSLKTTLVCVILLGVLYGMYQVINTPAPSVLDEETPIVENFGAPVDPSQLDLFKDDPTFAMEESLDQTEPPRMVPSNQNGSSGTIASSGAPPVQPSPSLTPNLGRPPRLAAPNNGLASAGLAIPENDRAPSSTMTPNPADTRQANLETQPYVAEERAGAEAELPGKLAGFQYPNGLSNGTTTVPANEVEIEPSAPKLTNDDTSESVNDPAATRKLSETWTTVDLLISKSRFQDALVLLSTFYEDDMLTTDEQSNLQTWLDALAAKVIYSMEPTLEFPHVVRQGETLEQIAASFQIPPTLLYNINRDRIDNDGFKPGTELKVVRGPFRAEVNLTRQRLTLWLDDMYAGSFPIRVGRDPAPETGTFRVANKTDKGRAYTASSGSPIPEMAPNNPYGKHSIDLGRGMLIHGSPEGSSQTMGQGCIVLKEAHARDVYEILDRNSEVKIVR